MDKGNLMSNCKTSVCGRRAFLKACAAAVTAATVMDHVSAIGRDVSSTGNDQWINPFIGTGWHGHTFPGATAPFGLVQLSPDTAGPPELKWHNWYDLYGWDHCSGYHYSDNTVIGFSHTHLSGTGAEDLGDVLIMPMVAGRNWGWNPDIPGKEHQAQLAALGSDTGWVSRRGRNGYASRFSHAHEEARAGYYRVFLETPQVLAELTATTRCGMHRYTYPKPDPAARTGLMLDLVHGLGCRVYHSEIHIESPTRISGKRFTHGWAANKQVYFTLEFSEPLAHITVSVNGRSRPAPVGSRISGKELKAILHRSGTDRTLLVKAGISCTGIQGAKLNLTREIPHWNFDRISHGTQEDWSWAISSIDAELLDANLNDCFYSGLYHGMMAPATFNDADGTYRGEDHRNHPDPGFTNYTTMSIWDIYRGEFPLLTLAQPQRVDDIVKTLLLDYRQLNGQSLPVWPLWGNETWAMDGFHSVAMILAAYTRGFRHFDVGAAYAAMRETALVGNAFTGRKRQQEVFRRKGYVPSGPRVSAVSATLDLAYDYWCVGAMAQLLGKHDDMKMFYKLGQNYRNLFDAKSGFMRGRLANGEWRKPFQPDREYWSDYTESDAWQATFNVVQDVQGLIHLYGGDEAFIAKLDELFTAPSETYNSPPDISAMVGQDAQGNEPSNHIPYLYCFAGAAWKTQYWVRKMLGLYLNSPAGIPGNDDCGQTSSCFVLGALGFYSVNPATGVYVIGSPLVRRATIHNPNGKKFTITTENNSYKNVYIQSAKLNGRPFTRSWLTHAEILAGGELNFVMGRTPNKAWAAAHADRPPSGLVV
jgi:predicted alpha-1,2-mannosidase